MNILAAAYWLNKGKAVRRRAWSADPADDSFHLPCRMHAATGVVCSIRKGGNNWHGASFATNDLLAVDWELIDE